MQPDGFSYINNLIPDALAQTLVRFLESDDINWEPVVNGKNSRVVCHYGFKYNSKNIDEPVPVFPEVIKTVVDLIKNNNLVPITSTLDICIINRYLPGQGIHPHVDGPRFDDDICCVTINAGSIITFTKGHSKYSIYAEPNSLYIMSGSSRYEWLHEMPMRFTDIVNGVSVDRGTRYSITIRSTKDHSKKE